MTKRIRKQVEIGKTYTEYYTGNIFKVYDIHFDEVHKMNFYKCINIVNNSNYDISEKLTKEYLYLKEWVETNEEIKQN